MRKRRRKDPELLVPPRKTATREEHRLKMLARSTTLRRRETYMRNTTPERRSEIARNAWRSRKDVA